MGDDFSHFLTQRGLWPLQHDVNNSGHLVPGLKPQVLTIIDKAFFYIACFQFNNDCGEVEQVYCFLSDDTQSCSLDQLLVSVGLVLALKRCLQDTLPSSHLPINFIHMMGPFDLSIHRGYQEGVEVDLLWCVSHKQYKSCALYY